MGEWITIPAFADGTIIRAEMFQDIWTNLYSLKDGEADSQQMPGLPDDTWTTSSSSFVAVNADYYRLTFESFGGDLLIVANIECSNSDASGVPVLTVIIDGVNVGGSSGLYIKQAGDIFEAPQLMYIATGVAAGVHVIYVAMRTEGVGTTKVFKKPCMTFSVMELS